MADVGELTGDFLVGSIQDMAEDFAIPSVDVEVCGAILIEGDEHAGIFAWKGFGADRIAF